MLPSRQVMSMSMPSPDDVIKGDTATELSSNRTSLSFERTRMSADRTLMFTLRTSLSLITFGFTIYETVHQLAKAGVLPHADRTARNLGMGLLFLGVIMLMLGVWSYIRFSQQLTGRRDRLFKMGLVHRDIHYRATPTLVISAALLLLAIATLVSIFFRLTI
jgi:putative membrane protein